MNIYITIKTSRIYTHVHAHNNFLPTTLHQLTTATKRKPNLHSFNSQPKICM